MSAPKPYDYFDPVVELRARIAARWQEVEDWGEQARRHRADAHRYWADIWRRRQTYIGPIERRLWDPNFLAWNLVLMCLDQRHFAILRMRAAIPYALELEAELARLTAAPTAGCASGAVRFSGEGPEPRASEVSVCGDDVPSCRNAGASSEVA